MILLPTDRLIVEGPDCVGKSSLIREIHKQTGWIWNIHDRSSLSMLLYGEHYSRNTAQLRVNFWKELTDLNNFIVVLLPAWKVVENRFQARGDEFQDVDSLKALHEKFSNMSWMKTLPNVLFLEHDVSIQENAARVIDKVKSRENSHIYDLADDVASFVEGVPKKSPFLPGEASLRMQFSSSTGNMNAFNAEGEAVYYSTLRSDLFAKIAAELSGYNQYQEAQTDTSRRFILNNKECISLIHVLFRGGRMKMHCALRSTHVKRNVHKDLFFLEALALDIRQSFSAFSSYDVCDFDVQMHCAHITR